MAKAAKSEKSKPSLGTTVAKKMRAEANTLSDQQRDESMAAAMQVIYGKGKAASHVVRH